MVSVIANRANLGMGGTTWEGVASSRGQFLGYAAGKALLDSGVFGFNGTPICERVRRAIDAVSRKTGLATL